jgi:superfamily I DNA/RNA helicase
LAFLTDLALDPPEAVGAEAGPPLKDEDWLILSTIHSAKGQEWRAVHILNVVDGAACLAQSRARGMITPGSRALWNPARFAGIAPVARPSKALGCSA